MKRLLFLLLVLAPQLSQAQKFWDAERISETVLFAGSITADGWATQQARRMGGFVEENPLARPLINKGSSGQSVACVLGFAVGLGPSYLFYRSGHKKLSSWWLRTATGLEVANGISMVALVTTHRPAITLSEISHKSP